MIWVVVSAKNVQKDGKVNNIALLISIFRVIPGVGMSGNFWVPMGTGYRPEKKFWVPMGTGKIFTYADPW